MEIRENDNLCYIIKHRNFEGVYKIGVTKNLRRRMTQLNNASPYGVEVVHFEYTGDNAWMWETSMHQKWAHKRINNEWFEFDAEELELAKKDMTDITNLFFLCEGKMKVFTKKMQQVGFNLNMKKRPTTFLPMEPKKITWTTI